MYADRTQNPLHSKTTQKRFVVGLTFTTQAASEEASAKSRSVNADGQDSIGRMHATSER